MLRCLFITMILGIATQNANASFVMRNTTAFQYTTTKSEQNVLHSECNIKQRLKLWHPKIHLFSQSNGYKALVCGLAGLVIFPMGIKAISYAKARLKERQDVVMARTGKILGTISYVLLAVGICGLLGWLAYKNPGFAQAMGQFLAQLGVGILQGLADNSD